MPSSRVRFCITAPGKYMVWGSCVGASSSAWSSLSVGSCMVGADHLRVILTPRAATSLTARVWERMPGFPGSGACFPVSGLGVDPGLS